MSDDNKKPGDHDRFTIIVNARQRTVDHAVLSFEEVVELAFPNLPLDPNRIITITFKNAQKPERDGTLIAGQTVTVKNGTHFNVTATNRS